MKTTVDTLNEFSSVLRPLRVVDRDSAHEYARLMFESSMASGRLDKEETLEALEILDANLETVKEAIAKLSTLIKDSR